MHGNTHTHTHTHTHTDWERKRHRNRKERRTVTDLLNLAGGLLQLLCLRPGLLGKLMVGCGATMAQGGLLFLGTDLADLGMQVFVGGTRCGRHHQILQSGNLPLENFNLKSKGGQQFYNCGVNLHNPSYPEKTGNNPTTVALTSTPCLSRKVRQQSYNCGINLHKHFLSKKKGSKLS